MPDPNVFSIAEGQELWSAVVYYVIVGICTDHSTTRISYPRVLMQGCLIGGSFMLRPYNNL